jgi:hypothetical protein
LFLILEMVAIGGEDVPPEPEPTTSVVWVTSGVAGRIAAEFRIA